MGMKETIKVMISSGNCKPGLSPVADECIFAVVETKRSGLTVCHTPYIQYVSIFADGLRSRARVARHKC